MNPPSHPHEVNSICATCTQDCKQPAFVKLLECVKYERLKPKEKEDKPKA